MEERERLAATKWEIKVSRSGRGAGMSAASLAALEVEEDGDCAIVLARRINLSYFVERSKGKRLSVHQITEPITCWEETFRLSIKQNMGKLVLVQLAALIDALHRMIGRGQEDPKTGIDMALAPRLASGSGDFGQRRCRLEIAVVKGVKAGRYL
jgi:hypothetical protein